MSLAEESIRERSQGESSGRRCRRRWYAVGVHLAREEKAAYHLRMQGYQPFLPRQMKTVRHARRLLTRFAPFFPGYMFVPLDLSRDTWRSINGTYGVRSLIMQGGLPVACPVGLVESFIEFADDRGLLDFSSTLQEGGAVRIASGPFAQLVGKLERLSPGGRAQVLLSIMNGEVLVTLESKDLVTIA